MVIELAHAPKLGGVVPFSTCDYPGRLACVVFVAGCPWRCHYCHNPHLQTRACHTGPRAWADTQAWLASRAGLLDAVVFCGGEPLVERHLPAMIAQVRRMGFAAALHTGGAYPDRLAQCLPMLEWVGFDVKAPFAAYPRITQIARSGTAADRSLGLVAASGVAFECRITIHPALLDDADLLDVARALSQRGIAKLVLQPFRRTGCTSAPLLNAPLPADYPAPALLEQLRAVLPVVEVRDHG